jgi:hypothetical protein
LPFRTVHLLRHAGISHDTDDHEPLTDLLSVFLGLGVFTANSVIREHYRRMSRRGYLGMPEYGCAFALFARSRGEGGESSSRERRLDVRAAFKHAMRFLSQEAPAERQTGTA